MTQNTQLNLMLLGKTGAGKSASGNTILGRKAFVSKKSSRSKTQDVVFKSGNVCQFPVNVYDTPGLFDTELNEEDILQKLEDTFMNCESDMCVFLLVIKADRFTKEERKTVEKIEQLLGQNRLEKTWILFTRGDELEEENTTIQEFIEETEALKTLVQKYDDRYHVFNNKKGSTNQVQSLLVKIFHKSFGLRVSEGGGPLGQDSVFNGNASNEHNTTVSSLPSRRIALLGKSGVGKSAAGNTILGQKEFSSELSMNSETNCSSAAQATVSGRSVSVVDTPGLFDTQMKPEELMMEIARSVYLSSPGPHAFLIVFPVNMRFTEQEQLIPQMIELLFGEDVLKYSIILFTHGDLLKGKTIEKLIEENCRLRSLVQQCGGRYHVFNNRDVNNREQVEDLLQKIDSMIQQNGGAHYTNQMFEDALRARQEEEEERQKTEREKQREKEEKRQREEEDKKINEKQWQEEIQRVRKETEERVRAELNAKKSHESNQQGINLKIVKNKTGFPKFLATYMPYLSIALFTVGGAVIGGVTGAIALGVIGGLSGGFFVGVVGAISGGVVGAISGAAGGAIIGHHILQGSGENYIVAE